MEPRELEQIILDGNFVLPGVTGSGSELNIPGVRGWSSDFREPYANRAGLTGDIVGDSVIDAVIAFFEGEHKGFTWVVGPGEVKNGLPQLLMARGFVRGHLYQLAGMALTAPFPPLAAGPSARIMEVDGNDILDNRDMYATAYGIPEEIVRHLFYPGEGATIRSRNYMAFCQGVDKPVGFCVSVYMADETILLFKGAAVLPAYRRRGIYRAMLEKRILDAQQEGIDTIIIHADRITSFRACQSQGFREICATEWYQWRPASMATADRQRDQ